ncbi:MAG: hypothetical protein SGILL_005556 [Bacillariaceae sp.]
MQPFPSNLADSFIRFIGCYTGSATASGNPLQRFDKTRDPVSVASDLTWQKENMRGRERTSFYFTNKHHGANSQSSSFRLSMFVAMCFYFSGLFSGYWYCSISSVSDSFRDALGELSLGGAGEESRALSKTATNLEQTATAMREQETRHKSNSVINQQRHRVPRISLKPNELWSPTPVIVMGMMKAGTTSIYGYFKCGLEPGSAQLSHYDCKTGHNENGFGMSCGKRMRRNLTKYGKPAFDEMDHFTLYAELDAQEGNGGMTLPQWSYLEQMYDNFPKATWILNLRDPQSWLSSVDRWEDLRQRFIDNPFEPTLPRGKGQDDIDMIAFYLEQAERIRSFCKAHPSITLVELKIDTATAGQVMEDAFGISRDCWGNRNVNDGKAMWKAS